MSKLSKFDIQIAISAISFKKRNIFFVKINTIMLLIMYQFFSFLLSHLPFLLHFFHHFYGITFFGTPNTMTEVVRMVNENSTSPAEQSESLLANARNRPKPTTYLMPSIFLTSFLLTKATGVRGFP